MNTATSTVQQVTQVADHHTMLLVLGITGLLALAVLVVPLAARLKIPFTVMLAAVGVLIGLGTEFVLMLPGLGILHEFVTALNSLQITSDAVFFVFLPALVFESALSIDVRRLFDDLSPILMLAIVGLLISTAVIGFSMAALTHVPLLVCLLLGAIVSATDPVAVVAIFKDLGAPQRLAILVEGESLFNDATAIVVFTIISAMLLGQSDPTLLSGIAAFIKVFFGGIIVGYLAARLICFVLVHIGDSNLPRVTLTISLAYLSFIIAEHSLHVSGVMAVVTAALVLGSRGRSVITQSAWHGLEEVWEQVGFVANSVIFILVGLKVPSIMAAMTSQQFGWLGVLLLAGFVARFAIIFGLVPAMGRLGWSAQVSTGYRAVMFWGGLRGAVSLALALAVIENDGFAPQTQEFLGVMVTGFVLFTLAVNATTVSLVMRAFGLAKLGPADTAIRDRAFSKAMASVSERVKGTARAMHIGEEQTSLVVQPYEQLITASAQRVGENNLTDEEWLLIGLRMVCMNENKAYAKMLDQGEISSDTARSLFGHAADGMDSIKHGGLDAYLKDYRKKLGFHWHTKLAMALQRHLGITGLLAKNLANRFQVLEAKCTVLHNLRDNVVTQLTDMIGLAAAAKLQRVLEGRDLETEQALQVLRVCYPEYAKALEKRVLQQTAMRLELGQYNDMMANSLISKEVASKLKEDMGMRYEELKEDMELDLGLDAKELVSKMHFFQNLDQSVQHDIAKLLKPRLALPDEVIFEKDGPPDAMYFISSGAVRVELDNKTVIIGSGDFFGEMALLHQKPRMAGVVSDGFSELLVLHTKDFNEMLSKDDVLREQIEKIDRQRTIDNQYGAN
ncbi:cation:proton antiporter [Arenicella xantha]|uniref:Sodium/proton antiporter (CPA1 family) n=1 Tax=Arenicella xantha TaxID=644221 RepID=A0A395JKD9_9GAMM|nr:cation:proton antiporter [Arenicella xantha]RBP51246.1 sodium/proton antiporter (CPA1 family) [Arenicella xantha]